VAGTTRVAQRGRRRRLWHPSGRRKGADPSLPEAAAARGNRTALRIAGVDPERNFAGGQSQVLGLTIALNAAGHRAELLCDPAGALWERARAAQIECFPLRIRNSVDAAAGLRLRGLLQRTRYDVVHFHTARAHSLAPFAQGRACALIVTRRMDYAPNRLFAPWLYNRAVDGVAAISPAVADALVRSGVARDRIALIPSGVDCDRFRPPDVGERAAARAALGVMPGDVAVGTVGMLEARKGQRFLLDAIALLAGRPRPDNVADEPTRLRCFIAGAGAQAGPLAVEIGRRELGESVRMLGALEDPRALLWALDLFVMPSLAEGLGVAALEAMACGLAVIASATGGLADAVVDEVTGRLVAPGDAEALAGAIVRLAAEPEVRAAMGAAGRARVAENFALEAMARRTLELYRECIARGRGRRG
jgi:glycosyltransferase involved in cell wall biosynthesis